MTRYRWKTYANKKIQNQNNAQEKAHKKDDHACDSLRYFIMSQPDLTAGYDKSVSRPPVAPNGFPVQDDKPLVAEPGIRTNNGWAIHDEHMGAEW
jgi:hypothetical protein